MTKKAAAPAVEPAVDPHDPEAVRAANEKQSVAAAARRDAGAAAQTKLRLLADFAQQLGDGRMRKDAFVDAYDRLLVEAQDAVEALLESTPDDELHPPKLPPRLPPDTHCASVRAKEEGPAARRVRAFSPNTYHGDKTVICDSRKVGQRRQRVNQP